MEDAITAGADTTVGADPTVTAGAGGEIVVIPALVGFGATLAGMYSVGRAYDNIRYWNDYYKRTGFRPKYPFIRGSYDYLNQGASAFGKLKKL